MLKHYRRIGQKDLLKPFFLFGVRFEIQDVRSGYRASGQGVFEAPWLEGRSFDWAQDMVADVALEELEEIAAPQVMEWPESADSAILRYFLHYRSPEVWKNYSLSVYSTPSESDEEFFARCRRQLLAERSVNLDTIRDVFLHRFLEVEQRALESAEEEHWDSEQQAQRVSQIRGLFSGLREDFSECFSRDHQKLLQESDLPLRGTIAVELTERLEALRAEFLLRFNDVLSECFREAAAGERYKVALNHSQIEIVTRAVLWE